MSDALKGRPLSCVSNLFRGNGPGFRKYLDANALFMAIPGAFATLWTCATRVVKTTTLNGIMLQIEQIGQGFLFIKDC